SVIRAFGLEINRERRGRYPVEFEQSDPQRFCPTPPDPHWASGRSSSRPSDPPLIRNELSRRWHLNSWNRCGHGAPGFVLAGELRLWHQSQTDSPALHADEPEASDSD